MEVETLVEATRTGDTRAFGRIVAAYQGLVCSVAYSLTGDLHRSEDIAQETFVAAWQRIRDLRDPRKLPAWLCGIARNRARSAVRDAQHDPLRGAASIDDRSEAGASVEPETMEEPERLELVWRTLEEIPEEYREPLVLFYREGQSVRDVSEALELSEDCVKQRLSRGRKMMKERVARLVEETLEHTRPGEAFTASVMAALPPLAMPASIAAAVSGKSVCALKAAAALAWLAGPIIGVTGGFFGMWAGIRNSPTVRLRRMMLQCACVTYAFIWLFFGYEGLCGVFFWREPRTMYALCGLGWAVYIPALCALIWHSNRWWRRVAIEDAGELPAPATPLEESSLARSRVQRWFAVSLALAVAGSVGTVIWIHSMPWTRVLWPAALLGAALAHYAFFTLFRKGMAIAHDEAAVRENPSPHTLDEALHPARKGSPPSERARFLNDLAALAGSLFGPMAPAFSAALGAGRYRFCAITGALTLSAFLFGIFLRRTPNGRRWGFFGIYMAMGVICGVSTAMAGPFMDAPGISPMAVRLIEGAVPLALYWGLALALCFILERPVSPAEEK